MTTQSPSTPRSSMDRCLALSCCCQLMLSCCFFKVKFPSGMELYAKDLIKRFLMRDVSQRLGNLEGGAEDVKRHRFFRGTDWVKLAAKEVAPPIIPRVNGPTDSSYFEIEELEPENSQVEKTTVAEGLFTVFN